MTDIEKNSVEQGAKRPLDIIIDIETIGTQKDCVILSIGAVCFDPLDQDAKLVDDDGSYLAPTFYQEIIVGTQVGRVIDPGTKEWWNHSTRVQEYTRLTTSKTAIHLVDALSKLLDFMKANLDFDKSCAWGNAPDFDIGILSNAFTKTGLAKMHGLKEGFPIPFYNLRDARTLISCVFDNKYSAVKSCRVGTYHNALDDAMTEAIVVKWAMKLIKERSKTEE